MQLTEEQTLIRDTARAFASEQLAPKAAEWDREARFPKEAVAEMGRLGFLGMVVPEDWDGAGAETASRSEPIGRVTVHFDRFELETPKGIAKLTTREAGLLRALVDREGQAVTRGELLEEVWGLRPETNTRVVDNFVVRLRRYLEEDPSRPRHIVAVRGHGYRLVR